MAPPGTRRSGREDGANRRLVFAAFTLGGGVAILIVKSIWAWLAVVLSFGLILWYGLLLWDRTEKRPRFDHAGDNLYYVGFLYTLFSLAHSLYRFTADGDTGDIVTGFGLALSSTVFGLVGRVIVNQPADDEPGGTEARSRAELARAHRELRAEMDYAIADYKRFREDLGELRESVERAKGVTFAESKALADEAAKLEDVRGLASRLDKAAEGAIGKMAERQEEMAVQMKDEAMATLRNVATQQEALSDGMAKAQREALDRVAARLDEAASSLARTIETKEREIEAQASALESAVDRSLESFRAADFEREVAARVLDPAEIRLRQLIEEIQPLVESLGSTQAGQERAVAETGRTLQQLSRAFAQNEDLAGRYRDAADSLATAASALESLPEQFERQSARSETVAREAAATGERLRRIGDTLESASASLASAAESSSKRRRGLFGLFLRD